MMNKPKAAAGNVIYLSKHKAAKPRDAGWPEVAPIIDCLSQQIFKTSQLHQVASCEMKGKNQQYVPAYIWRVAETLANMSSDVERLERKLRKAKKSSSTGSNRLVMEQGPALA